MKFSILIPVYNVESFLSRCLDSILVQKIQSYEVILVNDGSTDSSGSICDQYVKKYPQLFNVIHKKNAGVFSARRTGLVHAKGEYICFLDSDDYWAPNYLEELDAELAKQNPDVIIFGHYLVGDNHRLLETSHPSLPEGLYEKDSKHMVYATLLKDTSLNTLWCKCIRRALFDIDRDYSSMYHVTMGEDLLESLPILDKAETIKIIHTPLYNYYQNEGSATQTKLKIRTMNSTATVLQELEIYALKWDCSQYDLHQRQGLSVVFIIKQLVLHRFGKFSYSGEERSQIIARLQQDDFKQFIQRYDPSVAPLSLRLCFISFRKKWYAFFQLLLISFGSLYYCKKHWLPIRKGNKA
ncbi:MAG TPA: glycosyltransferase family 2 protein [Bacteroidales bacterium]|nr:glycosyltransferase family 2 protein [Bacteroidales bacterium]